MIDLVPSPDVEVIDTSTLVDLRPTALIFTNESRLTYAEWSSIGAYLQRAAGSVNWWLGDWLNAGERRYGETYAQAIVDSGVSYDVLRDCKWVAGRIPPCRRKETLSWSHHREVSGVKDEHERLDWLAKAEAHGWSKTRLRDEIRIDFAAKLNGHAKPIITPVNITIPSTDAPSFPEPEAADDPVPIRPGIEGRSHPRPAASQDPVLRAFIRVHNLHTCPAFDPEDVALAGFAYSPTAVQFYRERAALVLEWVEQFNVALDDVAKKSEGMSRLRVVK